MLRCEPCNLSFKSHWNLAHHFEHSRRHFFDCERCDLHFDSATDLEDHQASPPRHNICYACSPLPDFMRPEDLSSHEQEVHNICSDCHIAFDRRSELEDHREAQHCVCHWCRRSFDSVVILENVSLP